MPRNEFVPSNDSAGMVAPAGSAAAPSAIAPVLVHSTGFISEMGACITGKIHVKGLFSLDFMRFDVQRRTQRW